ncbi:complex I intermediate-associated protein 30, mitochondrial-like [Haliotis rufescens]|uniref:complex I intermediate-associated protein 30, mitochondrial-like n=1 Tax=Haliotis rufescens TaxID=6454 RepID=UPI001EAFB16F|nr:complex I intermediate-associated protein 30, mitochondrial-like [Haliotis rufescens]
MSGLLTRQVLAHNQKLLSIPPCLFFNPSRTKVGIYETDKKSGYGKPLPSHKALLSEGMKGLKGELKLFGQEIKEKCYADPFVDVQHGDYTYEWKMNTRDDIDKWVVTSDHDNNEGLSKASLVLSTNNTAMFHGYLSQEVMKDGIQKRSGYAGIRSPSSFKSFKRKVSYDWSIFNCLVMRVRGDGRTYMINIHMNRAFDVGWNDQYNYGLFTRGGPYWQVAKIPFSKFYLTSKGRIQDKQEPIQLTNVSTMGLSIGDGNEGPFSLEIDYIGLMYDENHYEEFAYEMYQANPAHVGT